MKKSLWMLLVALLLIPSTYMQVFATAPNTSGRISYLGPQTDEDVDISKPDTPTAVLDLATMTLSNMPRLSLYSVNDERSWLPCDSGGTQSLEDVASILRPNGSISIYIPAIPGGNVDSDTQIIRMGQSTKPSGFQVTPISSAGGTGSISGLNPSTMEFSYDNAYSWSAISSDTVSDLEGGTYYIRAKSSGSNFASEPASVTITIYVPPTPVQKEPTPRTVFDARTMTLSNIPSNGSYSLDGSPWTAVSGSIELRSIRAGSTLSVKALGDGVNTLDSDVQTIAISKQPAPSGVTPYPANSSTGLGGLNHVNSGMNFRLQGQSSWRSISGNTVTDLPPGNYEIVTIASGTYLDSDSITVTVTISQNKTKSPTPNGNFDAPSMAMLNLSVGMSYSFNGGHDWINITDNHCNKVTLSDNDAASSLTNGGIRLKMLGNNVTTIDSDIQTVRIAKASPPSNITTTPSANADNGSIQNVNSGMQYAKQNGNWTNISGTSITGLSSGSYLIRVKASGYTLSSDVIYLGIDNLSATVKESTPNANFDARIMTLSNIRGVKFSIDGGDNWTYYTDRDSIVLQETLLSPEKGIKLYRPSNGSTTNSEAQIIKLTRAGAPTLITVTNATSKALGSLHGVNYYMEYKISTSTTFTDIAGDSVLNLQPGAYHVRVHGQNTILPSPIVAVLVTAESASAANNNASEEPEKKPLEKEEQGQSIEDLPIVDPHKSPINDTNAQTEPILIGNPTIKGWDSIIQTITPHKPILIELHGDTSVPSALLKAAKDANSDIIIGMDHHVQWYILANSIMDADKDIDLLLTDSAIAIPDKSLGTVTDKGTLCKEFTLSQEGAFGFSAYLTLPIDSVSVGKYANLLYYNPESGEMEYIDSCIIDSSGYASFQMQHASAYAIIVANFPLQDMDKEETSPIVPKANETPKKSAFFIFIFAIIIVTVLLITLSVYLLGWQKKKNRKS